MTGHIFISDEKFRNTKKQMRCVYALIRCHIQLGIKQTPFTFQMSMQKLILNAKIWRLMGWDIHIARTYLGNPDFVIVISGQGRIISCMGIKDIMLSSIINSSQSLINGIGAGSSRNLGIGSYISSGEGSLPTGGRSECTCGREESSE